MDRDFSIDDILPIGADDYIGLWEIVAYVNGGSAGGSKVPDWVQARTLQLVQELSAKKLVEPGFPVEEGFKVLDPVPEDLVAWIKSEWDQLGHTPSISDITWFRLTPEGQAIADAIV